MNDEQGLPKLTAQFSRQPERNRRSLKSLSIFDIQNLTLTIDLSNQPRQHFAGSNFDKSSHSFVKQQLYRFAPPHRRCHLSKKSISRLIATTYQLSVDVRYERDAQIRKSDLLKHSSQFLSSGLHQLAMKRRANRKHNRSFDALRLRYLHRTLYCRTMARNSSLVRRIDICRRANTQSTRFVTDRLNGVKIDPYQRSHCAHSVGHCLLHI